eukprot:GEMP01144482.1.p1 GENE.GEMP01144482.1~~GEMP01144482.1.p1  ORF type:complete len:107 (+),score=4.50 GEMP01144482.1:104-424(+)
MLDCCTGGTKYVAEVFSTCSCTKPQEKYKPEIAEVCVCVCTTVTSLTLLFTFHFCSRKRRERQQWREPSVVFFLYQRSRSYIFVFAFMNQFFLLVQQQPKKRIQNT